MRFSDILRYSFGQMKRKKIRATLTILGVLIGVAAIVSINSLGTGFQTSMTAELEKSMGVNTLRVTNTGFGGPGGSSEDFNTKLYYNDSIEIGKINGVDYVTATISKILKFYANDNYTTNANVVGTDINKYAKIYDGTFLLENGTINNLNNESLVLGYLVRHPYGNDTLIANVGDKVNITFSLREGQALKIVNYTFTVVATLKQVGGFSEQDRSVYIPISTMIGIFNTTEVDNIVVKVSDTSKIDQVKEDILSYYDGEVNVISAEAMMDTFNSMFSMIILFLSAIGFISLVVAGVGIMNIMTVSVTERTREIGILKSVGAKNRTILAIFLSDAFVVGIVGGVLGIIFGYIGATILGTSLISMLFSTAPGGSSGGFTITIQPVLGPSLILISLGLAIGLSLLFAYYPARTASKKNPVEALRYE